MADCAIEASRRGISPLPHKKDNPYAGSRRGRKRNAPRSALGPDIMVILCNLERKSRGDLPEEEGSRNLLHNPNLRGGMIQQT
jgi:hypothetical protein